MRLAGENPVFCDAIGNNKREDMRRFADTIHQNLCRHSRTYEHCHMEGYGFAVPDVLPVAPGTFRAWRQAQGKPDGKVPRIIAEPERFKALVAFARSR